MVVVQHVLQRTATLQDYVQFHNEHRIILPQVVDLGLILLTKWNRQVEMTFDLTLVVGEAALLLAALRRIIRSWTLTLLLVVPLSLLLFSFAQYGSWLAPYQITSIMTTFGVAICVWAFSSERLTWKGLALGIAGAVIAASSALGGTATFIAFFPAIMRGGKRKSLVWIVVALAVLIPYFQGFPHSVPFEPSLTLIKYVLISVGGPLGTPHESRAEVASLVGLGLVLANLALYWYLHRSIKGLETWLGLGLFVLANAVMAGLGRLATFGVGEAMTSRYQVFSVLWWVMLLALIAANTHDVLTARSGGVQTREQQLQWTLAGINGATVVGVCAVLILVSATSLDKLRNDQYSRLVNQACVVNYPFAPPSCLELYYPVPSKVQTRAAFLEQAHLGLFSGDTSRLQWRTPNPLTRPLTPYRNRNTGYEWVTIRYDVDEGNGYVALAPLGYVYAEHQPNTLELYSCLAADGRHFLSIHAECQGQQMLDTEGWIYAWPPVGIESIALYNCVSSDSYVVTTNSTCSGRPAALLGYILTQR